ncbi:MAG: ribosome-associated translation inhibitor RaiA [Oscillospiraceae bacterium]|nr:ribosome-associated translation inhibitor RaiA [Oscillospiraceae bacterium]
MTIKITSKDIAISPETQKMAEKKISQRLKKYGQRQGADFAVTIRVSDNKPPYTRVDVDMPYLNYSVHAEAVTSDGALGGIDKCMDILDRQVEKYKTRMHKSRVKSSGLKKEILDIVTDSELMPSSNLDTDEGPGYKIIKTEVGPKPMSVEEAILQMEVLEYKFLFFHNIDTDSANVVYKRDDGNIGQIEA